MSANVSESIDVKSNTTHKDSEEELEQKSHDELQKVSEFFETNQMAIEKWLRDKAPDEVITKVSSIISSKLKDNAHDGAHRSSVTSELYQQWLSSSSTPLKVFYFLLLFVFT